jgi:hypothetical protein
VFDRLAELWMSVLPPAIKADIIRTIDELMQSANPMAQPKLAAGLGITNAGITGEDQFYGWAPDVQILTENDLKKIEKQEERKARYDKRKR